MSATSLCSFVRTPWHVSNHHPEMPRINEPIRAYFPQKNLSWILISVGHEWTRKSYAQVASKEDVCQPLDWRIKSWCDSTYVHWMKLTQSLLKGRANKAPSHISKDYNHAISVVFPSTILCVRSKNIYRRGSPSKYIPNSLMHEKVPRKEKKGLHAKITMTKSISRWINQ